MIRKYVVLALIIAVVASLAAVGCSSKSNNPQTTPFHTPAPTVAPTAEPTEEPGTNEAATATSLDFTIEVDAQGAAYTYQYRARNIGTSSLDIRVDVTSQQFTANYIVSGSSRQGWINMGQGWVEFTTMYQDFDTFWNEWANSFEGYHNYLAEEWTGLQGWTYDIPGDGSVTYTNIDVNPSLPDSIFQPD